MIASIIQRYHAIGVAYILTAGVTLFSVTFLFAQSSGDRIDCGVVSARVISEASGVDASHRNHGILWTHNDSGDIARVFAIDTTGAVQAEFHLAGIEAFDCEDIAVGPGPEPGISYIYLADIGDNLAIRENIRVYRFPEPNVKDGSEELQVLDSTELTTFTCYYPDGPRDAETLLVDPDSGDLLIVTKREQHVRIYRLSAPHDTKLTTQLTYLADIALTGVVGGDISHDGRNLLFKTYTAVYCWQIANGTAIQEAVLNIPQALHYIPEPQGEAICWDRTGDGYYTLSERSGDQPLHLYYYPVVK